jgi:hypothetical protein
MSDAIERRTVDGISVKVGDTVFRADTYTASDTSCRLYKHHLGMWWERLSAEVFSTEQSAILGAIGNQKKVLAKARKEVRRANKAIERLTAKLTSAKAHNVSKQKLTSAKVRTDTKDKTT